MQLSDLKSGNIVETREEEKYIVLLNTESGDILVNLKSGCYLELCNYTSDLISKYNRKEYDIMKVCAKDYVGDNLRSHGLTEKTADYEWTWERDEKKEMTVSEIEKELGYSIKIVKED